MPVPQQLLSRKDMITADFTRLAEKYIADLVQQKTVKRLHTKDFAAMLFIHPRHLTNTITLTTGISPCEHLEEKMIAEIKKLLLETHLPVAAIGYRFLYDDPANFSKFFKNLTGTTPLRFRKTALRPD